MPIEVTVRSGAFTFDVFNVERAFHFSEEVCFAASHLCCA